MSPHIASLPLTIAICCAFPANESRSAVIVPVGATASSRASNDASDDPMNLINGNGFTATIPIENSTHSNAQWFQGSLGWYGNEAPLPFVNFDLGAAFDVGSAHVWNWNGSNDTVNWGVASFDLIFSRDSTFGNGDDTTRSFSINAATGLNTYTGQHYSFASEDDVTHIRFQIQGNQPGGNGLVGLSEVRFSTIPEPSSVAFIGSSVLLFVLRRRSPPQP